MCLIPCVLTRLYITKLCLLSFGGYISNAAGHLVSARRVSDAQVINHSTARGTLRLEERPFVISNVGQVIIKRGRASLFVLRPSRKPRWCGNNFLGVNDVYLKLLLVIHQAASGQLYPQISQVKGQQWAMWRDASQRDGNGVGAQKWAMRKTRLSTILSFYFYPNNIINRDRIYFRSHSKFAMVN